MSRICDSFKHIPLLRNATGEVGVCLTEANEGNKEGRGVFLPRISRTHTNGEGIKEKAESRNGEMGVFNHEPREICEQRRGVWIADKRR